MDFEASGLKVLILTGNRYDLNGNYIDNLGGYAYRIVDKDKDLPLDNYVATTTCGKVTQLFEYKKDFYSIHYLYNS